jgi:hypothetical protein
MFPRGDMLQIRSEGPEYPVKGRHEQMQCGDCNGIKNRIQYLTKKSPSLRGALKPLSPEERKDWMVKNNKLVGEDLAKVLHQSCAQASLTKQLAEFKAAGKFVDFEVAKEQFKDKPEQWDSIQLHAQTHRCQVRNVMMYWIPEFSMTLANYEIDTEERKRRLESSAKMAAAKKKKIQPAAAVNVAPAVGEFHGNPPEQGFLIQMVAVKPANKKRLESCIIRLETKQMELTSQMAEAEQEKFSEVIPQRLHTLCNDISKGLDKTLASAKAALAKGESPKGFVKQLFDDINMISATCSDLTEKLGGAMSLADM